MPNPAPSDYLSMPLTGHAQNFLQDQNKFVFPYIAPMIPVIQQSASYHVYDRADALRVMAELRGPTDPAVLVGQRLSSDSYHCDEFALKVLISDQERANSRRAILDVDMTKTAFVTTQLMMKAEKQLLTDVLATSKFTGSSTGSDINSSTNWMPASNGSPLSDILTEIDSVEQKTGMRPNLFWCTRDVMTQLRLHANFTNAFYQSQPGPVSEQQIASLLGVDKVLVSAVSENTASEGLTAAYSYMKTESAAVLYVPQTLVADDQTPSAAYSFVWSGLNGSENGIAVRKWRDEERRCDVIEGSLGIDFKVTGAALGAFFTDCLTS